MPLPLTAADRSGVQFIEGPNGAQLAGASSEPLTASQNETIASLQAAVSGLNDDVAALSVDGPGAAELAALDAKIDNLDSAVDTRVTALNNVVIANVNRVAELESTPEMRRLYLFNTRAELDATGNRYHAPNVYCLVVTGNQTLVSDGSSTWNVTSTPIPALAVKSGVEVYGNLSVAEASTAMRTYTLTGLSYIELQDYIV